MFEQINKSGGNQQPALSFAEQRALVEAPKTPAVALSSQVTETRLALNSVQNTPKNTDASAAEAATAFLQLLDCDGRHNLVAIDPLRGGTEGRTFPPRSWDDIRQWVAARNGRKNIYFSPNEPLSGAPDGKLKKEHISNIRVAHVDIDPVDCTSTDVAVRREHLEKERARLKQLARDLNESELPPSIIIDSGGGIQALWFYKTKMQASNSALAEAQNKGLIEAFQGDAGTFNIDRLLRLPGTENLPNAAKIEKGRVQRRSVVMFNSANQYEISQLEQLYPSIAVNSGATDNEDIEALKAEIDMNVISQVASYADLSSELRDRFEILLECNAKLRILWETGVPQGETKRDASAARFRLAHHLKPKGFSIDEYGSLLWIWPHATSTGKQMLYEMEDFVVRREIARCWAKASAPLVPLDPMLWFDPIRDDQPDLKQPAEKQSTKLFELVSFSYAASQALKHSAKPLIKGLLDQGALSVLYGESNVGKTFVAMDLAFSIAAGLDWAGCRTTRLDVLYIAAEGSGGAYKRAEALKRRYGTDVAEKAGFHFLPSSINLLRTDADLQPLIATIRNHGSVKFVVVDTLSRALAGGDENASTDMGAFIKNIDKLRQATSAHIMLVHHSGKDRTRGARGHSLLRAATDTEIEIADNEIKVTKQRDLDGNFVRPFALERVVLDFDADGDPITSCTVRFVSQAEKPVGNPTAAETATIAVLRTLATRNPTANGFSAAQVAAASNEDQDEAAVSVNTARSRLRSMEKKRLVVKPRSGFWALNSDKMSGESVPTTFEKSSSNFLKTGEGWSKSGDIKNDIFQ